MNRGFYKELIKRNGYFISEKAQNKISATTLVFIGCGLASNVAVAAARMGFLNFVLVDGDTVEISNLNRQDFTEKDIGKNKAKCVSRRLKEINSEIQTRVIEKHLCKDDVLAVVSLGDIVINSADFDEVTYEVDEVASTQSKLSISPLNIGFGTITTIFTSKSKRLMDMTGGIAKSDKQYLMKFYRSMNNYVLPEYIKKNLTKIFLFIAKNGYFPQNVIAANTTTIAIMNTIVRHLDGKAVKVAPESVALDVEAMYE